MKCKWIVEYKLVPKLNVPPHMADGWQPLGGAAIGSKVWQTMVKYCMKEDCKDHN